MGQIKALISDFDGTLVDTFEANFQAYKKVFMEHCNYEMSRDFYKENFGLRIDDLCKKLNIEDPDEIGAIKFAKSKCYPSEFKHLKLNLQLLNIFCYAKKVGIKIALASTASKKNLYNVLKYYELTEFFDVVICGEDVTQGKPNPEVYTVALDKLGITPDEALVFEDSEVGMKAAENAGIKFIKITI